MICCPMCKKVFKYPAALDYHMVTHTKEKPHKCHLCSLTFGSISNQKQHIKSVHEGIKQIKKRNSHCSLCSYKCYSKTMLRIHFRIHSTEQQFSCSIVGCEFKTKHEFCLQRHVRVFHRNERPYACPSDGCNHKARSTDNLRSHLKTHSDEKPFACKAEGCNYRCKFKNGLTEHISSAHSDETPSKCSQCDFRSKHSSSLMRHLNTHEKIKRFQCQVPYCDFASHEKGKLKLHFDRKHGKKNVFCVAPGCNFRCGAITLLKQHQKIHERPVLKCPCGSCNFRTRHKKTLLSHISRRHENFPSVTKEKLHCHYPNSGYEAKFPQQHDRHSITQNINERRKHVCTFCYSRFTELGRLRDHLQRHTGEKPYRCSRCKYTSASSVELRGHAQRVHHIHVIPQGKADELRKCRICNIDFWSYSELVLHSMNHLQPVVVLEQLKLQVM